MSEAAICDEAISMFGCDKARISSPMGTMFLILGWKRNTKEHGPDWRHGDGTPFHFDYLEEKAVAHGDTEESLRAAMFEYKRIQGMSMTDYLAEIVAAAKARKEQA